ncbi:MAG: aspartate/tyrosine/aromatic aminotransferase [Steroidobacteraceae bacterium]|jgi:aspartate/tyrosine/aromatic aminotransferase|nr:aspartate/tyrosine/aromatic aminotransferase [Steroidobacteraceae bacterium]
MLQTLSPVPPDALLGITTAFRADTSAWKVDLGVGVYRDEQGITPIMRSVRESERRVIANGTTKVYVGPAGNREFAAALEELTLGADHPARKAGRVVTLQAPGGCGALRLGAELAKFAGATDLVVSDPTWANHVPLLSSAGLRLGKYAYLDAATGRADANRMLDALATLPAGTLVLLQGSCHNPTGADLDRAAWHAIADLLDRRGLVPFVDIAYQGLGDGLEEDAYGVRLLAERLPEVLIAVSCSKNFGLYRERVGATLVVGQAPAQASVAMGHLQTIARRMYSMPPDHGAAIVAGIWADPQLRADWQREVAEMRTRVLELRRGLAAALRDGHDGRFDFVADQRGMFSLLGLPPAVVERLRTEHHVYMAPDSRVNIAGLKSADVVPVARAIRAALAAG